MVGKAVPLILRLHKHSIPEPNSGCWIWTGALIKSRGGGPYGVLGEECPSRSMDFAHRISYRVYKGPIEEGMHIDHLCSNTYCVNPDHLEQVTNSENTRRAHFRLYGNNCKRGHPFDEKNTWIEKNGQRHCRRCHADREAKNRANRRAKQ